MAIRYEVVADAGDVLHSFGVFRSEGAANAVAKATRRLSNGYPVRRARVLSFDSDDHFQVPPRPAPRERFTACATPVTSRRGRNACRVEVFDGGRIVASYERDHAMLDTFEPFRRGDRFYALVSPTFEQTAVMDLATGVVVATDEGGFCPAGFYVPDWWDIHPTLAVEPGSVDWRTEYEWPSAGDIGFVWGCVRGDDAAWKVQHLDLSDLEQGRVGRDARYGHVELDVRSAAGRHARDWVRPSVDGQRRVVTFSVPQSHDMGTGEPLPRVEPPED